MKNFSRIKCAAAIILGLLASQASSAQSPYAAQVQRQLNEIETIASLDGYEKTHNSKIGKLQQGGTVKFTLNLRKGWEYVLAGVCDNDCSDLDIRIFDENNNEIAKDTTEDDKPMVEISPRWTGTFQIEVKMYRCGSGPCAFGVGAYGK